MLFSLSAGTPFSKGLCLCYYYGNKVKHALRKTLPSSFNGRKKVSVFALFLVVSTLAI